MNDTFTVWTREGNEFNFGLNDVELMNRMRLEWIGEKES
jgi:hypothetical protein